mmetsp:Transcript_6272/g.8160  ORF Transcript_6272/g.8160 Transcript_6272/m.8160 type:complete len:495 (-) Transcript_6272:119-1603(-)|eukprot:CAMPEP_0198151326 /NCGR_PEP_ID=MMETSP1443-20131203/55232_1 /TAXON_ID=186043 /ORGANISM="Entomoneis sp., Strain CCMP2396" /LENGTH=494 /DNA_ID=CAMNT_0043816957 /DNA_START=246 /DNA_END=1730 /DNA_ORIENTATION=+
MNTTEIITSKGRERPVSISSTSSLDSLLVGNITANNIDTGSAMESITENIAPSITAPSKISQASAAQTQSEQLPAQSQDQLTQQHQQQQHTEGRVGMGAVTPSTSVAISPLGCPVAVGTDSATVHPSSSSLPALVLPPQHQTSSAERSSTTAMQPIAMGSQAPEFLYQLTKMLTDNNRETIEWNHGKIEVHSPHRLEAKVLHKYFRHSKFASFQRQLNYFGFRKQAGKGKMAPCSYVNENLPSTDLNCLLHIKRKTSIPTSAKEKDRQTRKVKSPITTADSSSSAQVNPVLAGILQRSSLAANPTVPQGNASAIGNPHSSHQAVAQAAVGRGIRHGYSAHFSGQQRLSSSSVMQAGNPENAATSTTNATFSSSSNNDAEASRSVPTNPLSQLVSNYQNTLNDMSSVYALTEGTDPTPLDQMRDTPFAGFLSREDSLIDLAMIPILDNNADHSSYAEAPSSAGAHDDNDDDGGFNFIDFPNLYVYPSTETKSNDE